MKPFFLLLLVPFLCNSKAQTIRETALVTGKPIRISLSPALTTTLLFPSPISATFGLGLVTGNSNASGSVQLDHPDGSCVLVLHALTETAHVIATVLLDGKLYVLDLLGSGNPDVAVTFRSHDQDAPRAIEVTPQDIVDARPKYDPQILDSLLRRARDNVVLRPIYPDLYQGYQSRETWFTSDSGSIKTTVTNVHRFPIEDAVVLQGAVENETDHEIKFDGRAVTVQAGNRIYPIKYLDAVHSIPAHQRTLIDCVIQGDIDGGRANLSVDNKYRIYLPGDTGIWQLKNGVQPDKKFNVPTPLTKVTQ